MGQTIQLRRVRMRPGMGDDTAIFSMPTVDVGTPTMPDVPPPVFPVFTPAVPPVPASISVPIGPLPSAAQQLAVLSPILPAAPVHAAVAAGSSWMNQQFVSGVKNKYLVYAGAGIFLLSGLKRSKGRRR